MSDIGRSRRLISALTAAMILASSIFALAPSVAAAPPTTTLTFTGDVYVSTVTYVNALTFFNLAAEDENGTAVTDIWYRWDDYNWTEYTAPFHPVVTFPSTGAPIFPLDLDGLHTLRYNSTDSNGVSETPNSLQVYVDNYAPATTLQTSGESHTSDQLYITSSTQISLSASDDGSKVASTHYQVDTGSYNSYSSAFTLSAAGPHTIKYYSVDNLGNQELQQSQTVFVDDTDPVLEIDNNGPAVTVTGLLYATPDTPFILSAEDASGVSMIRYKVDSASSWLVYTNGIYIPTDGAHSITAYAEDNLGHACDEVTLTVIIDSAPPTVEVTGAEDGAITLGKDNSLLYMSTLDTGVGQSTIYYSLDSGGTWETYDLPLLIGEDSVMQYYAEDSLGNQAGVQTINITVVKSSSSWILITAGLGLAASGIALIYLLLMRKGKEPDVPGKKEPKEEAEPDGKKKDKRKVKRNN